VITGCAKMNFLRQGLQGIQNLLSCRQTDRHTHHAALQVVSDILPPEALNFRGGNGHRL